MGQGVIGSGELARLQRELITLVTEREQLRLALEAEVELRREVERGWVSSELEREQVQREVERVTALCTTLRRDLDAATVGVRVSNEIRRDLGAARREAAALQAQLDAIYRSRFWRYSRGPRWVVRCLGRLGLSARVPLSKRQPA